MWLERIVYGLFPTLLLQGTPWYDQWIEDERHANVVFWRLFFPVVAIIYIGHYFYFDKPSGLEPQELWFRFRMSIAGISFATALFYCSPSLGKTRLYKIPAILTLWILCYTQARTIVWYDESQYLYAFFYVVISATLLRTTLLWSILFSAGVLATQWSSLTQSTVSTPALLSGVVTTILFVAVARSKYLGDIRYFLANQENVHAQRQMIEMNIEFNDRIRAFLPKQISARLTGFLSDNRMSVLQAVDEVLRPSKKDVACLFTDIRGFTQGTKRSDLFVNEGVIPNVRRCTSIIERHQGIPRKVGDLIFAYFDEENPYVNLIRCIQSGFQVVQANCKFNTDREPIDHIHRYVLISSGPAIVGNLGGYDSSIEITALGSPVNLLSRIDELTKLPAFKEKVRETDLVLCDRSAQVLLELNLDCEIKPLVLSTISAKIRDFEEVNRIWILPTNDENLRIIANAYTYVRARYERSASTLN
jgi:class 3 adenylate cyclase